MSYTHTRLVNHEYHEESTIIIITLFLDPNLSTSVNHWRLHHQNLPLRDFVMMEKNEGSFIQISNVFSHAIMCGENTCGHVVYTNNLTRARSLLQCHASSVHKSLVNGLEMTTTDFLASNPDISQEIVDESSTATADPEVSVESVESLEVLGYVCGADNCGREFDVTKTCSAPVSLNKLKTHFRSVHRDLDTGAFKYETRYNRDVEDAVNVSADVSLPGSDDVVSEVVVYQCPAINKNGRQCPEMNMDINNLRIHWGSQHNVDGSDFSPSQVSIESVSHYQCGVEECQFKHLSTGPVKQHWEQCHQDCPHKFQVIHNKVKKFSTSNISTPSMSPVKTQKVYKQLVLRTSYFL